MFTPITLLDQKVNELTGRLQKLRSDAIALFSVACAERLSEFYEFFSQEHKWGDYHAVRELLDKLWEFLRGHEEHRSQLSQASSKIESLMPHADDFQGLSCVGAQDFCICLESAVRWSQGLPEAGPHAPQYALQILRAAGAMKKMGYSWVGDSAQRFAIDEHLLRTSFIASEIHMQEANLDRLTDIQGISGELIDMLRREAEEGRHHAALVLKM